MVAYLGYTLWMRTLFRGWPIMVNDTHTRRRRSWVVLDSSSLSSWWYLQLKVDCAQRVQTSTKASKLNRKWSGIKSGLIKIWIRIADKILCMHYAVGISHFAECGDCMRNANKSPKSPILLWWVKWKVIWNLHPEPDHHQKLVSSSDW